MSTKPIIGINADFRSNPNAEKPNFSYISADYFDAIRKAGGIPFILPPTEDEDEIHQLLEHLDGVLLVGGGDLDPTRDGWMLHSSVRPMDARRETFDRLFVYCHCERRIPSFGIGVGMQLLNVSQGGNLMLHIPEDCPNALPHFDPLDTGHRHTLNITEDSIMGRVYGDGELRVNSMHHMAVDEIAPGFEVTAYCPDGIIEAIECRIPGWFAFGTQFHPEMATASALDSRIFEEFMLGVTNANCIPLRAVA